MIKIQNKPSLARNFKKRNMDLSKIQPQISFFSGSRPIQNVTVVYAWVAYKTTTCSNERTRYYILKLQKEQREKYIAKESADIFPRTTAEVLKEGKRYGTNRFKHNKINTVCENVYSLVCGLCTEKSNNNNNKQKYVLAFYENCLDAK